MAYLSHDAGVEEKVNSFLIISIFHFKNPVLIYWSVKGLSSSLLYALNSQSRSKLMQMC